MQNRLVIIINNKDSLAALFKRRNPLFYNICSHSDSEGLHVDIKIGYF